MINLLLSEYKLRLAPVELGPILQKPNIGHNHSVPIPMEKNNMKKTASDEICVQD
jgi:hypothetical protein